MKAGSASKSEPGRGPRNLAQLIPHVTKPSFARRSPALASLLSDWPAVVGPALARMCEPRRISGTTLTLVCSGPCALEVQHCAASLVERINAYAGRRMIDSVRVTQIPLGPVADDSAGS